MEAVEAVRGVIPSERQRPAADYAIDGVLPRLALRPADREEVAGVLRAADEAGIAVVPVGGRTALRLGRPLARYDMAVDTTALTAVIEYEPDDLTITVEAGVTLAQLQSRLGAHGQYLPIDPPPGDELTVGGLLATARPGAWRGHLPAARDLLLGLTVALPDGTLTKSGGRVVKNVSGYDLHRLHTGALGALGVIVEASFKVTPLPAAVRACAVRCTGVEQAAALASEVWDAALPLRALSVLTAEAAAAAALPAAPQLMVEFAGSPAAIERCERELRARAVLHRGGGGDDGESGDSVVEVEPGPVDGPFGALRRLAGAGSDGGATVLRLGVPPVAVAATIEAAQRAGCTAWGHPAAGQVLAHAVAIEPPAVQALREHAVAAGGYLQVEAAPAALRAAVDPFGLAEVALPAALRERFDPRSTLNPGRWGNGS